MASGIVFDFKRYTLHDGPGIRASIHLKGCSLRCWWCHNPESQDFRPQLLFRAERCIACNMCIPACPHGAISIRDRVLTTDLQKCLGEGSCARVCPSGAREICGATLDVDAVMQQILKERIFFEQSGGGVTLSGGEPLGQPDFALGILEACRARGIHTAIDTCGFVQQDVLLETLPLTNLYLYDVKHMDPVQHKHYTGVDNEIILDNLRKLGEGGAVIHARMPFIPGINSGEENLHETAKFLAEVPGVAQLHLLPYHTAAADKHRRWSVPYKLQDIYAPTENAMRKAAAIVESHGVKAVIGG